MQALGRASHPRTCGDRAAGGVRAAAKRSKPEWPVRTVTSSNATPQSIRLTWASVVSWLCPCELDPLWGNGTGRVDATTAPSCGPMPDPSTSVEMPILASQPKQGQSRMRGKHVR